MFAPSIYMARRRALAAALPGALILFLGNDELPMNFRANVYPFRQDGCFRYFFGVDRPGLAGLIDADSGEDWLFGDDDGIDSTIWFGPRPRIADLAEAVGVHRTAPRQALADQLAAARAKGRDPCFPPPYQAHLLASLASLLDCSTETVARARFPNLIAAIVQLREVKAPEEITEMAAALEVTRAMHHAAMAATRPGVAEHAVVGRFEGIARGADLHLAYQSIFSGRGEVLHNLRYDRTLAAGELVVNDSAVASAGGYASDITRTLPVAGRFDPLQRRLYETVLDAQQQAIAACRTDARFLDIHLQAARTMVATLVDLGLFRGDPEAIVASGAYALCFQCGLGHQIGLDVHDMEALGEDRVGYDAETSRSTMFGLRNLRLGKRLRAGMTVTVEPGLYFIPAQMDQWRAERRHESLIDYDRFDAFRTFGGIRIEDDIVVTDRGGEIIGPPILRTVDEVEDMMGTSAD